MQNVDVAHQFFYDDINGSFSRNSMNVSYRYGRFFSYGTCIAEITKDINNNTVCIISDDNFSMTTAKHLSAVRNACKYNIYYLPTDYGCNEFYITETIAELKRTLENTANSKLTLKANRERFTHNYKMLESTLQLEKFKEKFKEIKAILKLYKSLYDDLNNPAAIKQIKELQAKRLKQQQAKLKRILNNTLKKYDYLTLLENIYSYGNNVFDNDLKTKLKHYFNPQNDLSFIWFKGDYCCTSQHITAMKNDVITLLKLWQHNKLKHGMTIDRYTVLEVQKNYVKVGCHKIPTENLNKLLESIENKKELAA